MAKKYFISKNRLFIFIKDITKLYLMFLLLVYFIQRFLLYYPDQNSPSPEKLGVNGFQKVVYNTSDNLKLFGWYKTPQKQKNGESMPTIIFFHGNADKAAYGAVKLYPLVVRGFGLLLVEYRGYSGNEGKPTEDGLIEDARTALAFLIKQDCKLNDVIIYGHSLGSGVATALAAENNTSALILESPYSSILSVAKDKFWFLPVKLMLKDTYRSDLRIKKVKSPLLIIHGQKDNLISIKEGERLFELANMPKEMVKIPNGQHMNLYELDADKIVISWLSKIGMVDKI
ncbi:MAG: alpha/beta hydrolase [Alphaproteobacteria bacterium]